jgi:cytochrome P450
MRSLLNKCQVPKNGPLLAQCGNIYLLWVTTKSNNPVCSEFHSFPFQLGVGVSLKNPVEFSEYQAKTYGEITRECPPALPPLVWTNNPEDAETMFHNEGRFPFRFGFETLKKYRKERAEHYSAAGLLIAQGEDWWKMRSKAQQSMMKPKNIYNYLPAINEIGDEFIDRY